MGDGIAAAIRSKMKTLHPFPFLVVEDLKVSRQIDPRGFESPGPEMNLVGVNASPALWRRATLAGRSHSIL